MSSRARAWRPLLFGLAAIAAGLLPASGVAGAAEQPPVQSGVGIRLAEAPVSRHDDPRAHIYIVDHVDAPSTFSRRVEVTNGTTDPVTVDLYPVAARIDDGKFVVENGRATNALTSWLAVSPPQLELAPGATAPATVTVSVPEGARAGEHYGAVVAALPPQPAGNGLMFEGRVGVRVYLSVGTGAEPATDFELRTFQPVRTDDGRPGVVITACNTGARAVDLTGELTLADGPGGTSAGPFRTNGATTVAPAGCAPLPVVLSPELPRGPWQAAATLRSGPQQRSAEGAITFPDEGEGAPVVVRKLTDSASGVLALVVAALLLALVLAGLVFVWWRRHGSDAPAEVAAAP